MSSPPTVTLPEVAGRKPVMIRRVVVLPAPFGPRNPRISPGATSKETSRTASTGPYRLCRFSTWIMSCKPPGADPRYAVEPVA